jgi:L-lactate dehydrogenase complex protein LldG
MNPDARELEARTESGEEFAGFLRELRLRSWLRPRTDLPDSEADVRQVGVDADLVAQFAEAARSAGLRVHRVSESDWIAPIAQILSNCGARVVFLETAAAEAAGFAVDQLTAALERTGIAVQTDASDETLFRVDAGITGVECAVAESGTLVCQSGAGRVRGGSLIPPLHVALVKAPQVVPDLYDCLARYGGGAELPANVNLITGPSKTADIEGVLVTGVHGPREVHVILVEQSRSGSPQSMLLATSDLGPAG